MNEICFFLQCIVRINEKIQNNEIAIRKYKLYIFMILFKIIIENIEERGYKNA